MHGTGNQALEEKGGSLIEYPGKIAEQTHRKKKGVPKSAGLCLLGERGQNVMQ